MAVRVCFLYSVYLGMFNVEKRSNKKSKLYNDPLTFNSLLISNEHEWFLAMDIHVIFVQLVLAQDSCRLMIIVYAYMVIVEQ